MAADKPDSDPTRSIAALTAGARVSHYKIIDKIGSGGMGDVYLAEDTELDRRVALKFLPPHLCRDEDCRKRFNREARAAAKLDHPNVAAIYEVGEHAGRPFYAMQIVEGQSLKEVIAGEELSIKQIIEIGIQVCEGLEAAHDQDIIHRDIKPSNILLDSHGRARIVDFGLASVRGSEQLTRTGSTLGTIGYMSPEQVAGREVDRRSDLFSLGVVLYELTTRQSPFLRDNEAATLRAVSEDRPEPLARFASGVPEGLETIVAKALEKDRETRYQTAAGMASDLKRLVRGAETDTEVRPVDWWNRYIVPAAVVILLIVFGFWWLTPASRHEGGDNKLMLAVLPFENLGDAGDEYFADGITEEITTSLAGLSGLGVISRTSASQYKSSDKSLRQIGKELKVDCILNGTIRWDKSGDIDRVRITAQLIGASDDVHLWADRYDALLTDVFGVQATIARDVSAALDIALLQAEEDALAERPDAGPEAYDYYLRGKQYFSLTHFQPAEIRTAERMHTRAIELAPDFALAYAELGALYTELYWYGMDTSQATLDKAREMIDAAVRLAPDAPETFQALGWYYYHGRPDFGKAIDAFSEVLKRQPNNSQAIASIAWVNRRQGKWEEAIAGLLRALKLAPREPWYYYELGNTYTSCRRFAEAVSTYDKTIDLDPNNDWAFFCKAWAVLNLTGKPDQALAVVEQGLQYRPESPRLAYIAAYCHLCAADYERALGVMTGPKDIYGWYDSDGADYYYMKGTTYALMRQPESARLYLDSARAVIENILSIDTTTSFYHSFVGKVYASLGLRDEAIAAARRGVELLPVSEDALDGPRHIWDLAIVYATIGEPDLALEQLDSLFTVPSEVSVNWLRIAPEFTSLHDHPQFSELLARYAAQQTEAARSEIDF